MSMAKESLKLKVPDKVKEPYSWHKWKEHDLLNASTTERIIMLELMDMESLNRWLFGKVNWDYKDMRKWVRHVAKRIDNEAGVKHGKGK